MAQFVHPFSDEGRGDPYPSFAKLRAVSPALFDAGMKMWLLTGFDVCSTALRSADFSAAAGQLQRARTDAIPESMLNTDGELHGRLRARAARAFGPNAIGSLSGTFHDTAARVLEGLPQAGSGERFDLVGLVGVPFAAGVLGEILELDPKLHQELGRLAACASPNLNPLLSGPAAIAASAASADLTAFLTDHSRDLALSSPRGPLGQLLCAPDLTEAQKVGVLSLAVIGGYEPLVNLIGNGLHLLLNDPQAMVAAQGRNPSTMSTVIDEILRMEAPIPFTVRVCLSDAELAGKVIEAGQPVLVHLGAANRDPAKFAWPDVFVADRAPNPHLGFGGGVHFCLGAAIVRVAGSVLVSEILRTRPTMARAPGGVTMWRPALVPRGLESLEVVW